MAKVLLVDDVPQLLQMWTIVLEDEGHDVLTAEDGVAALQIYDRHRPDLVITDLELPGLHGLGVIARLRSACADVKIIAMSGSRRALLMARKLGVPIALHKPVGVAELIAATRWTLRGGQKTA
jgi:DNA-binding response OmpR family regulator